jgi:hypothetical protein
MLEEGLIKCKVNQDPNNPDEYYEVMDSMYAPLEAFITDYELSMLIN